MVLDKASEGGFKMMHIRNGIAVIAVILLLIASFPIGSVDADDFTDLECVTINHISGPNILTDKNSSFVEYSIEITNNIALDIEGHFCLALLNGSEYVRDENGYIVNFLLPYGSESFIAVGQKIMIRDISCTFIGVCIGNYIMHLFFVDDVCGDIYAVYNFNLSIVEEKKQDNITPPPDLYNPSLNNKTTNTTNPSLISLIICSIGFLICVFVIVALVTYYKMRNKDKKKARPEHHEKETDDYWNEDIDERYNDNPDQYINHRSQRNKPKYYNKRNHRK